MDENVTMIIEEGNAINESNVVDVNETAEENGISHFIEHMLFKGTKTKTAREIAEKMDLPIGTVKSRIFFARQRLQKILKDYNK